MMLPARLSNAMFMSAAFGLTTSLLVLGGCDSSKTAPTSGRAIAGLSAGDGLTFTSTGDGSVLSILYDTAKLENLANASANPKGEVEQSRRFSMVLGRQPVSLRFTLRGFVVAPVDSASLAVTAGQKSVDLGKSLTGENFTTCFDVAADGPALDVAWIAKLKQVPGQESQLHLDSIDISALADGATPTMDGKCP